jgi:hypothetical protein
VAEAYISGLEDRIAAGQPVDHIASVASIFVHTDRHRDRQAARCIKAAPDETSREWLSRLPGRSAIANAKAQYRRFTRSLYRALQKLEANGAQVQRPLGQAPGRRNPNYSDVYYIDQLMAPRNSEYHSTSNLCGILGITGQCD